MIGVLSIQKPSTVTRWTGVASGISQVSQPIQKVPPGTQTIPSGAGPGAGAASTPTGAPLVILAGELSFEPAPLCPACSDCEFDGFLFSLASKMYRVATVTVRMTPTPSCSHNHFRDSGSTATFFFIFFENFICLNLPLFTFEQLIRQHTDQNHRAHHRKIQ